MDVIVVRRQLQNAGRTGAHPSRNGALETTRPTRPYPVASRLCARPATPAGKASALRSVSDGSSASGSVTGANSATSSHSRRYCSVITRPSFSSEQASCASASSGRPVAAVADAEEALELLPGAGLLDFACRIGDVVRLAGVKRTDRIDVQTHWVPPCLLLLFCIVYTFMRKRLHWQASTRTVRERAKVRTDRRPCFRAWRPVSPRPSSCPSTTLRGRTSPRT